MIEVDGLTKIYDDFVALDEVTFSVDRGEVLAFLGPNGAGKSTTMKILTGYLRATRGTATIAGFDVARQSMAVRERMGYLPERTPLYDDMQVDEFLQFAARLRGLSGRLRRGRIGWAAEICHLDEFWKKPISVLSRGQRQRVGFAQAILHDPPVLILDEPTAGLDPNQIIEVRDLIRSFAEDKTVILSTHILQEVDALCRRAIIVHHGRIVTDDSLDNLRGHFGTIEKAFRKLTTGDGEAQAAAAPAGGEEEHDG